LQQENYRKQKLVFSTIIIQSLSIQTKQMTTEIIPIFFAANPGYYQHLCVALVSLLENNKNHQFSIYVLTDDDQNAEKEKIIQLKNQYDHFDIQFKKISDSEVQCFHLSKYFPHISIQTYYRILIPKIFPELNKAIYLDSDLIVEGDIQELWQININNYYLAGVNQFNDEGTMLFKKSIGLNDEDIYINCGVLLMNLKLMRQDQIVEKLIENAIKLGSKVLVVDQDVINYTLHEKILNINPRFNWTQEYSIKYRKYSATAIISHFTTLHKPWSVNRICYHAAKEHYFYYLEKTPYRNFIKRYRRERPYKCIIPYLIEIIKFILPKRILNHIKYVRDKYRYGESIHSFYQHDVPNGTGKNDNELKNI
jgi:lipopolysaccharide biosynthesis glycosyltransferase